MTEKIVRPDSDRLSEFVAALTAEERKDIILSYAQFKRDGFIGDAPVRTYAKKIMEILGVENNVTTWMSMLTNACYEKFWYDMHVTD